MANYNIKQIAYSGKGQCLTSFSGASDGKITPINFDLEQANNKPGDWGNQDAPYQQILLNGGDGENKTFNTNTAYYLELEIPKDDNFAMDFALLLIPEPKSGTDLDQLNYQFIRYLHVTQGAGGHSEQSRVVLYQKLNPPDSPIEVTIAQPAPADSDPEADPPVTPAFNANTLYYKVDANDNVLYMWTENATHRFVSNAGEYGYNDIVLSHSWKSHSSETEKARFELIFTPRVDGMKHLYLYLIPTKDDNDIQWSAIVNNAKKTYYGRHVNIDHISAKLYVINNLLTLPGGTGTYSAKRIGIWGRSELMLSINGEEVKIGPSNYYELQNFTVTNLGVAAQNDADRFTIDFQY